MSQEQNQSPTERRRGNKIEGGNARKKMNREIELSGNPSGQFEAGPGQGQELNVKEASINDLPPEMLMEILKCVDTRSLLALRLVNRNWNAISSGILCHRPDAQVWFEFRKGNKFLRRQGGLFRLGEKNLIDFLRWMKKTKNVPYAHFAFSMPFGSDPLNFFDHPHFTQFLSYFTTSKSSHHGNENPNPNPNPRLKGLDLKFPGMKDAKTVNIVVGKLGDLLLNKIPFVENLSLEFDASTNAPLAKLLPPSSRNQVPIPLEFPLEHQFQLPHLKVLRFKSWITLFHFEILQELLGAAVNLRQIYLDTKIGLQLAIAIEYFEFLGSLGKFHLLKNFEFDLNVNGLSSVQSRPDFTRALFNLELEELKLSTTVSNLNTADHPHATNFISRLFESNKNCLKKLEMGALGRFSALELPIFKTLTHLKLEAPAATHSNPIFFPPGIRSRIQSLDIFPAVRHLDLPPNWRGGFPYFESIPVFPSIKNLSVNDRGFTLSCISVLDLMCPNLKHLRIHKYKYSYSDSFLTCSSFSFPQLHFLPVGRQIWRLMKGLESLKIDIQMDSFQNNSAQLDSCFTGISVEKVKRLYAMQKAKNTRKKSLEAPKSEAESESESQLTAEREHPSILDMKSLKTLTINCFELKSFYESKMESKRFYRNKLTWISRDYAFKLLPNLKLD